MRTAALLLCALVLASCGKDVPEPSLYDPEEAFAEANENFTDKQYEEARRGFQELRRKDTTGDYVPLAQLRIADSYFEEKEHELAVQEYRRFLDDYPRHKYASYAQHQVGQAYYRLILGPDRGFGYAVRALEEFEKLMADYPRNPYRETVQIKIERCREILADHEFLVADFYFKRDAHRGTLDRLLGLMRDFPEYRGMDEVLYRVAVSYKALGKDAEADEYLDRLRERYPDSSLIEEAEEDFEGIEDDRPRQEEDG